MRWTLPILIASQVLFTTGDLMARAFMPRHGFTITTFLSAWFGIYFLIRTVAMMGQLYVFSVVQLGKTMAMFGACSIVLSNVLGFLVLGEVLTLPAYLGMILALLAFLVMAMT